MNELNIRNSCRTAAYGLPGRELLRGSERSFPVFWKGEARRHIASASERPGKLADSESAIPENNTLAVSPPAAADGLLVCFLTFTASSSCAGLREAKKPCGQATINSNEPWSLVAREDRIPAFPAASSGRMRKRLPIEGGRSRAGTIVAFIPGAA